VNRLRAEDGTTIVATVHDLTFAARYADRLPLLNKQLTPGLSGEIALSGRASVPRAQRGVSLVGVKREHLPDHDLDCLVAVDATSRADSSS